MSGDDAAPADQALRAAAHRLELALRVAGLGTWDWDVVTNRIAISARAAEIAGHPPLAQVTDTAWWVAAIDPEDYPRVVADSAASLTSPDGAYHSSYRIRLPAGGVCWVLSRGGVTERGADGVPTRITGTFADVTAAKQAELALRSSERRLELALRGADQGMWDWRIEDDVVTMSARSAEIHGMPARETTVPSTWWSDVVHPDEYPRVLAASQAVFEGRAALLEQEMRVRRPDGGWANVLCRGGITERAADGSPRRFSGTHLDITAAKQREQALRESEEHFRAAFEVASIGMCLVALDGRFLKVNRSWCTMLGYSEAELLALDVPAVTHPDDREATHERIARRAAGDDRARPIEKRYLRKDGSVMWGHAQASAVLDASGARTHLVVVVQDLTARREAEAARARLEEQLRQAQKIESIGVLAGGIAHDLNNLLTPVLGFAELARARAADPVVARQLEHVVDATERAKDLVQRLLAFARRQVLELKPVQVAGEVLRLEPLLRRVLRPGVELELQLAPDAGWVRADASQLQQILMNLTLNAVDAMPTGGTVRISIRNAVLGRERDPQLAALPERAYVVIAVADGGQGIDAATRARLFEPFFTTKPRGKGTGLGLATVHGIVKQHGGEITVDSAVGHGARFAVWLPLVDPPAGAAAPAGAASRGGLGERVLVVEDEGPVRDLVAAVLGARGYRVTAIADPLDALAALDRDEFELLITDIVMPGMDGRELHRRALARRPGLAAVFMSGYAGDELDGGLPAGTALVGKPFPIEELAVRAREAIDGAARRPR